MEGADRVTPALSVRDLRLRRGPREILRGVDCAVMAGEVAALMGLSGSGKTTVLRAVADLEPEGRGVVQIGGFQAQTGRRARGRRVGMVFQFHCLFEHLTVLENIALAPVHVHGIGRREAAARGRQLLDELGIGHRASALPRELSGGEAQRAAIARALAMDPPVLLLDEPTASLDPDTADWVRARLEAHRRDHNCAILLASHNMREVERLCDRVLMLKEGALVDDASPTELLAHYGRGNLEEVFLDMARGSAQDLARGRADGAAA